MSFFWASTLGCYKVHVHIPYSGKGKPEPVLRFWCFKPGMGIQVLSKPESLDP